MLKYILLDKKKTYIQYKRQDETKNTNNRINKKNCKKTNGKKN